MMLHTVVVTESGWREPDREILTPATADCAAGDQFCADQIAHNPMGGITQDRIAWVNRPTYQEVIEFPARRGDDVGNLAAGLQVFRQ